jgi:hypothetical protein
MDEIKKKRGAGAGRKPKADEIKLIETMDAIAVLILFGRCYKSR